MYNVVCNCVNNSGSFRKRALNQGFVKNFNIKIFEIKRNFWCEKDILVLTNYFHILHEV